MEVDNQTHGLWSAERVEDLEIAIASDGLLLYVGEAAYETGESPLSVWVPRKPTEEVVGTTGSMSQQTLNGPITSQDTKESPLDCFERLAKLGSSFQFLLNSPSRLIRRRMMSRRIQLYDGANAGGEMET